MSKWKYFKNIEIFFPYIVFLTNRLQVAVRLFRNKSQRTSKCGKNKKVAHEAQPSVSLMLESIC